MTGLTEQIKVVHEARMLTKNLRNLVEALRGQWEHENDETIEAARQASNAQAEAEATLRDLTLATYAQTGSKQPALGLGIREVTQLDYDERIAYQWAVEHSLALRLDKAAFEKIAKADPMDFVQITKEPQATITIDLTDAIKELEEK